MQILEKIKEAWPLVTKARFNRLKEDRDALLKEHKNMSDYVVQINDQVKKASLKISEANGVLIGMDL